MQIPKYKGAKLNSTLPEDSRCYSGRIWVATGAALIAGTTLIRLLLNLRHPLPPGMDAGYYPLQTLALLQQGELTGSTPPLIFWIDAALTKLFVWAGHPNLSDAAILATRLVDCFAHPWCTLPIMLLGYRWSAGERTGLLTTVACCLLAVLSPPVMRMASDFQKNSLGLVWLAFSIWAVRRAIGSRGPWNWSLVIAFLMAAALTHIGAFGVTCVTLAGVAIGYHVLSPDRRFSMRTVVVSLLISVLVCAGILALMFQLESAWARHLMTLPYRVASMIDLRLSPFQLIPAVVGYGVLAVPSYWLWNNRNRLNPHDSAIAFGCLVSLFVLLSPVLDATWSMRFQLMTPMPAALLILFCVLQISVSRPTTHLPRWLLNGAVLVAVVSPFFMQGPVITMDAARELDTFGETLKQPQQTLFVAPHGMEFWVAMMTSSDATSSGVPESRDGIQRILIVSPLSGPLIRPEDRSRHRGRIHERKGMRPVLEQRDFNVPSNAKVIYRGRHFNVLEIL